MSSHEYAYVLHHSAEIQRGAPEQRMLEFQRATGGGLLGHSAEHIGDLIHRLNQEGGRFGTEFVEPKVRSQLRGLTHGYGYEREHLEQMRSNAAHMGVDFEEHMERVRAAGQVYTAAHEQVPVYNTPSMHGAWAAEALGEMRVRPHDVASAAPQSRAQGLDAVQASDVAGRIGGVPARSRRRPGDVMAASDHLNPDQYRGIHQPMVDEDDPGIHNLHELFGEDVYRAHSITGTARITTTRRSPPCVALRAGLTARSTSTAPCPPACVRSTPVTGSRRRESTPSSTGAIPPIRHRTSTCCGPR